MTETRRLNHIELSELISNAPEEEKRNLLITTSNLNITPYEFFNKYAVEQTGIIINKRPIYFGAITENEVKELWTVVNSNVKEQFTLFKIAKRIANGWAKKYGKIYATMEKGNEKNLKWTQRIGFKKVSETEDTITFCLQEMG